jgi:hypothetical protein
LNQRPTSALLFSSFDIVTSFLHQVSSHLVHGGSSNHPFSDAEDFRLRTSCLHR